MTGSAQTERRGRLAETLAAWCLVLSGHRVVARRYRCPAGEIDLIVRRGRTLAYIEVKARADPEIGLAAVGGRQRRRIRRAAEHFLKSRPDLAGLDQRFDLMVIAPGRWPRRVRNAWTE